MDKPTILVVEDEPAIADTIQYALESEGFRCQRLEVGAGVVEVLDRQPVALVVLDIGLPDMSGIEVCRRIRERHDVPVIFLTARSGEVDRVVRAGARGRRLRDQALQPTGARGPGESRSEARPARRWQSAPGHRLRSLAGKNVEMEVTLPDRPILEGNPFLLHQALENLVQNAIEFSPREIARRRDDRSDQSSRGRSARGAHAATLTVEDRQVLAPDADVLRVPLGHDASDLGDVFEVVNGPCRPLEISSSALDWNSARPTRLPVPRARLPVLSTRLPTLQIRI